MKPVSVNPPTLALRTDLGRDLTFSTDLSPDVRQQQGIIAECTLGEPEARIALPATLKFTLENADRKYTPGDAGALAGFDIGRSVILEATNAGEAGPQLGQDGIGDGLAAALFEDTSYADLLTAISAAFDRQKGTAIIWLRPPDTDWWDGPTQQLFKIGEDNAANRVQVFKAGTAGVQRLRFVFEGGNTGGNIVDRDSNSSLAWQMIAITWEDFDGVATGEMKAYYNGLQEGATQTEVVAWDGAALDRATVGNSETVTANQPSNCPLAHFALWDEALTPAEMLALYDAQSTQSAQIAATQPAALIGHWPFSEASGLTATDQSGNNRDGTYSSTSRTHRMATMKIEKIKPVPIIWGPRRTDIECIGFFGEAMKEPVEVPIQLSKRMDEIVTAALNAAPLYPPANAERWLWGDGLWDTTTIWTDASVYSELDEGANTFPVAMDNNRRGSSLYEVFRLAVESEQGWIFMDSLGRVIFRHRHWLAEKISLIESFVNSMSGLPGFSYGSTILNSVVVTYHQRERLTAGPFELFTLQKALKVKAGQSSEVTWRYTEEESDSKISTTSGITPEAGTDYTAKTQEDSGNDVTSSVTVKAVFAAQSVKLTWTNSSSQDAFVQKGATVRGDDKIRDFGQQKVREDDDVSRQTHGRRTKEINARLLDDDATAKELAKWTVETHKDPRADARMMAFKPLRSAALLTSALTRKIGDRIALTEPQTALSNAEFHVMGIRHEIRAGGRDWTTRFLLTPVYAQAFWLWGIGMWDTTTKWVF